jgi:hypothetical protein
MAGETISLDYTPATVDAQGLSVDSTTPLLPGFQLRHTSESPRPWAVAKITKRVSRRDAERGIAEEVQVYPARFETQDEALEAAKKLFKSDGPGDVGEDKALQAALSAAAE